MGQLNNFLQISDYFELIGYLLHNFEEKHQNRKILLYNY